jgi:hypothetical protein
MPKSICCLKIFPLASEYLCGSLGAIPRTCNTRMCDAHSPLPHPINVHKSEHIFPLLLSKCQDIKRREKNLHISIQRDPDFHMPTKPSVFVAANKTGFRGRLPFSPDTRTSGGSAKRIECGGKVWG